ncbi:MAG: AraC family transcriptional regulator [Chloroflexota bacterium]|nr:AraC family transcriptional regulator [Chloroflexota bacterium]
MHDILADILKTFQLHSSIYCQSEISSDGWALRFRPFNGAAFHIVRQGCCWLLSDHDRLPVQEGDLVVLPRGDDHLIADRVESPVCSDIHLEDHDGETCRLLRWGDGPLRTVLICGTFSFTQYQGGSILPLLPPILHFSSQTMYRNGLKVTIDGLIEEANADRQGKNTVLHRLADILFVQIVRAWLADPQTEAHGWLAGLRDPQIASALVAVHQQPERNWTVAALASQSAMSRSAFAARFADIVGISPIDYLTQWRMHVASRMLTQPALSIEQIAERTGYSSDIAFSRAFSRIYKLSPSAYRRTLAGN